jgi:hypothetical protein
MSHVPRDHCLSPERVDAPIYGGRYASLFGSLEPLKADESALHALGGPGGFCAPGKDHSEDDADGPAGWPFFGQFIAHDITADRSPLGHHADPSQLRNFRTPKANLEGVYGAGPVGSPYLYDREDPAKLLLGPGGYDVPRNQQGIALVGDPRNDVHLFMSQMQVAWIRLHNELVDRLREDGVGEDLVFEEARRAAIWHYQHIILEEFLPALIGPELTSELLAGGARFYQPNGEAYIPFEFADAAYRYGHSQIRGAYQVNSGFGPCPVFPDLIGFGAVEPEHVVDWSLMFDVPGAARAQRAKRIDGRLPACLIELPQEITGEQAGSDYSSLATRDLQRGEAIGLPSGESVARAMDAPALDPEQVGLRAVGWELETPLWLYILREADVLASGERLGPVGGRIVGEVLVGIIDADPESFRVSDREWSPTLPARDPARFTIADMLAPAEAEASVVR